LVQVQSDQSISSSFAQSAWSLSTQQEDLCSPGFINLSWLWLAEQARSWHESAIARDGASFALLQVWA